MNIIKFNLLQSLKTSDFIYPWWGVKHKSFEFKQTFNNQLIKEISSEHPLYGYELEIIARGNGDDCLFQITDSKQVASVHLTWSSNEEKLPFPLTTIFCSLDEWFEKDYLPDFFERLNIPMQLSEFEQMIIGYSLNLVSDLNFEDYVYFKERRTLNISDNEYLELISMNLKNKEDVLKVLNAFYKGKFPDAKVDLIELNAMQNG